MAQRATDTAQQIVLAVMAGDPARVAALIASLSDDRSEPAPDRVLFRPRGDDRDFEDDGRPSLWGNA